MVIYLTVVEVRAWKITSILQRNMGCGYLSMYKKIMVFTFIEYQYGWVITYHKNKYGMSLLFHALNLIMIPIYLCW